MKTIRINSSRISKLLYIKYSFIIKFALFTIHTGYLLTEKNNPKIFIDLSVQEKKELTNNILSKAPKSEICITYRSPANFNILSTPHNTITLFGESILTTILNNSNKPLEELHTQKYITTYLLEHDQLIRKLQSQLQIIAQSQEFLLHYFTQKTEEAEQLIKSLYFSSYFAKHNTNPQSLELHTRISHIFAYYTIISYPLNQFIYQYSIAHQKKISPWHKKFFSATIHIIRNLDPRKNAYRYSPFIIDYNATLTIGDYLYVLGEIGRKKIPQLGDIGGYAFQTLGFSLIAIISAIYAQKISQTITHQKLQFAIIKILHRHLQHVQKSIEAIKNIYQIIEEHPQLITLLPKLQNLDIKKLITQNKTSINLQKINSLFILLDTPSIKKKCTILSHLGTILAAHQLMQDIKDELIPALEAVGILDAYLFT